MWIPRPFLTKILTHDISYYLTYLWLFDDYLMIICWLFVDYLIIICIIVIICYIEMWLWTTHPFSHLPGYAASQYRWPGLHVRQRLPLICLIPHCKVSPVNFDVGGEHSTNARMRTRSYNLCIWNSRIVLSACFGFDLFDGASATSANAAHQIEQAGSHLQRLPY